MTSSEGELLPRENEGGFHVLLRLWGIAQAHMFGGFMLLIF